MDFKAHLKEAKQQLILVVDEIIDWVKEDYDSISDTYLSIYVNLNAKLT